MKGVIKSNGEYIKRESEKDILRMGGGSWTVNLDWASKGVKLITYITEKNKYQISFDDAVRFGFERIFQGERKLVVPLEKWSVNKAMRVEDIEEYTEVKLPPVIKKKENVVVPIGENPDYVVIRCHKCGGRMTRSSFHNEFERKAIEIIQCVKCGYQM